jgi:hypothetical protein
LLNRLEPVAATLQNGPAIGKAVCLIALDGTQPSVALLVWERTSHPHFLTVARFFNL